jgi:hypothetical protein
MTSKQELFDLEKKYWQALQEKDVDTTLRLTDDQCLITGAQGVGSLDKRAMASMMNSATYTLDHFELTDMNAHFLSDDVAVLAYKVHEELTVDGKPVSFEAADASTWVRRGDRWFCALHTEAIEGDPFGRDRQPKRITE